MEEDTPKFSFHKKGSIHQAYAGTTSCPISPLGICIFFPRILPMWVILYRAHTSVPVKSKLYIYVYMK